MIADERGEAAARLAPLDPPWVQRGTDLSRVLALSDGIFAFAMTLLVLGLALPAGFKPSQIGSALRGLEGAFLAYILSFFVIGFYWFAHHQIFTYISSHDRNLIQLNITFLLFIAVMPFITNLLASANGELIAVLAYAVVQIAAGGLLTLLWLYASGAGRHVAREAIPREWVEYLALRTSIAPIVFAASLPIALANPVWAEYSWATLFVVQVAVRRRRLKDAPGPRRVGDPR